MRKSAVVDTSVLISAFLFRESTPGRVIALAEQNAYNLYLSSILLEEVTRSLHYLRLKKAYGYANSGTASKSSAIFASWPGRSTG